MAKNYIQPGDVLTLVAPTGGVLAGKGYKIGQLFAVAQAAAAEAADFEGAVVGVFDLTKAASQAWTEGALIYWDDSAKACTTTATSNLLIGVAVRPVPGSGAGETTGRVRLNGYARANEAGT